MRRRARSGEPFETHHHLPLSVNGCFLPTQIYATVALGGRGRHLAHVSSKATMMRLQGLEAWLRAIGSVLNETHKSAIRVYKSPHPPAPWLVLWSMKPRLALTPLRDSSFSADGVKGVEIIEPQTTAKPAREGVKL